MASQQEIELKLALRHQDLHRVENAPLLRGARAAARTEQLNSVYFDTPTFKLRKRGISLRVRSDSKRHIQTIKAQNASGDLASRDEWETELAGTTPDFKAARGTALAPLLSKKLRHALKPVFETRVERRVFPLQAGDAAVELSLDLADGILNLPLGLVQLPFELQPAVPRESSGRILHPPLRYLRFAFDRVLHSVACQALVRHWFSSWVELSS